jgi:hypothetical protein
MTETGNYKQRIETLETANAALTDRVSKIEGANKALEQRILQSLSNFDARAIEAVQSALRDGLRND